MGLLDDIPEPEFESAAKKPKPINTHKELQDALDAMEMGRQKRMENHEFYATRIREETDD